MFGDLFGGGFGGRGRGTSRARPRAPTSRPTATIGFTDAIDGVTISLRLTSDAPCPDCKGSGGKPGTKPQVCARAARAPASWSASMGGAFSINETCPACGGRQLVYDEPCPTCHGNGRGPVGAQRSRPASPPGVKDGQRIRLRGKGAAGENGGPAGDLFVTVKVGPHRLFGRKGDNLTLEVPISFDEAALGAEIKIPTLGGAPVTLKIPAGTPNGRTFRVRGKGAAQGRRHPRRPAGHRRGAGARPRLDATARAAVEAYRAATAGEAAAGQPVRGGRDGTGRTRPPGPRPRSTSSASPPS